MGTVKEILKTDSFYLFPQKTVWIMAKEKQKARGGNIALGSTATLNFKDRHLAGPSKGF